MPTRSFWQRDHDRLLISDSALYSSKGSCWWFDASTFDWRSLRSQMRATESSATLQMWVLQTSRMVRITLITAPRRWHSRSPCGSSASSAGRGVAWWKVYQMQTVPCVQEGDVLLVHLDHCQVVRVQLVPGQLHQRLVVFSFVQHSRVIKRSLIKLSTTTICPHRCKDLLLTTK